MQPCYTEQCFLFPKPTDFEGVIMFLNTRGHQFSSVTELERLLFFSFVLGGGGVVFRALTPRYDLFIHLFITLRTEKKADASAIYIRNVPTFALQWISSAQLLSR